jgi:hypothetical protein
MKHKVGHKFVCTGCCYGDGDELAQASYWCWAAAAGALSIWQFPVCDVEVAWRVGWRIPWYGCAIVRWFAGLNWCGLQARCAGHPLWHSLRSFSAMHLGAWPATCCLCCSVLMSLTICSSLLCMYYQLIGLETTVMQLFGKQ